MESVDLADVRLAGEPMGVVFWDKQRGHASFEYEKSFRARGVEPAPLRMPVRSRPYSFPNLHESFSGLPGLLADSLPDTYGNALIEDWLRAKGRSSADFSPVEKLCYIGNRGMGALSFEPSLRGHTADDSVPVEISELVELAAKALQRKETLKASLLKQDDLNEIIRVGTSAGGARAKAVIAWNPSTNEVRSGQAQAPEGFEHWLLKFDGVSASFDGVRDPQGYGRIEYAYHLMAKDAGIRMMPCRLFEEEGRAHFMTRRFDRPGHGRRIHYASLFGIAHMRYSAPGTHAHSYETLFEVVDEIGAPPQSRKELFKRMVFNVLGVNRDDHVKNFGFLMEDDGGWDLSPAFDVTFAHHPAPEKWTQKQQMSVSGKREKIRDADMVRLGRNFSVGTEPALREMISRVRGVLADWTKYADIAGVFADPKRQIGETLKRSLKEAELS